ncbi:MAG: glycosyltransferase family 2 protein [Alphaproteobacteria bacterium]|nr:glycosyltransferase family 2 protein [Alphaproteobacteria bacterium]
MTLLVSAVVCVRNGALRLPRALASIAAQQHRAEEIVLVDGDSTDATREIATAWPTVRVIRQEGSGLADARNRGVAAAHGDVIAFLDHDDAWTADKLAVQMALLQRLPPPAYSVAHLRFVGDAGEAITGARAAPRLGRTPGTLVAHRAAFDRVGPFDGSFGMGCDMDWFARAATAGLPCAVAPGTLLLKTLRSDALSADTAGNRAAAFAVIGARLRARRRPPPSG